jgi:hypothetical protein
MNPVYPVDARVVLSQALEEQREMKTMKTSAVEDSSALANTSLLKLAKLALAAVVASSIMASVASAQGFICTSLDETTQIDIYLVGGGSLHEFRPAPRGKMMVVKDITLNPKRQVVATFSTKEGLLRTKDTSFIGKVDPKHPDTNSSGKRVGGTRLGQLKTITVEIDYSFQEKVSDGVRLAAQVTYNKLNGEDLAEDFECVYHSDSSKFEIKLDGPAPENL